MSVGLRIVPQKSGDRIRKRCAKPSSVKLYCNLLSHYDVHLLCDICVHIHDGTHKCGLKRVTHECTIVHECSKDRLVLFAKNTTDNGDLLRKRPAGYNPLKTDRICEHVKLNEPCLEKQLCPHPHTAVERDLWKQDYNDTVSIASLVSDLRESSLFLSAVVEYLSKKFIGTFKLICATCFKESGQIYTKLRHVPQCGSPNHHHWEKSKKLVFEMEEDNRLIDFDDVSIHDEEEQELISRVRSLINDVSIDDMADEAARLRQADRSAVSCTARKATDGEDERERYRSESDDSDDENNHFHLAKTDEEIFDEDATDVLNDAAFDEDTGDSHDKNPAGPRVKGDYYKMCTEEPTQNDSKVRYGCGTIKLHGAFAGSCRIVGGELNGCEVELRGRVNCGPAFDGDEVRVKVYKRHKEVQPKTENSEVENSNKSDKSSQLYGTVVNVIKRNVHRTARTFVCTVGRHDGHLMTPLCGTVPKFHIVDTCLSNQYGPVKKNNYVAVYDSSLKLRKTVKLDPRMRREMLFVVKYLKWENKHKYPLGYVCRILRQSRTDVESQKILNLMYELSCNENTELEITAEEPKDIEQVEREDMCDLLTVSIDSPHTRDIDDALSLTEAGDKFIVWIHISDVTFYVRKGDSCDLKAQSHIFSFYPSITRQPFHMLPKKLAEDKCSLLEKSRRRAMSVRFEITADGEVLSSTGPSPSWIWNDKQLTYEGVQETIDCFHSVYNSADKAISHDLDIVEQMLIHLHELATALRRRRMGDGSHYYDYSRQHCFNREGIVDPFEDDQNHDANRLVEEFMILTNQHVGEKLKQKFPGCTPFRVQHVPHDKLLESWNINHGHIIPFSFYLKQYQSTEDNPAVTPLFMLQKCWNALSDAVKKSDVKKVRTVIGSEQLHPLHNIALSSWFNIQELSHYSCYVDDGNPDTRHFSLQTCDYVHFTSPLRRYVDIIAHRLVKADPDQPPPYTRDEVVALCKKMNARSSWQRSYDRACELLKMVSMLQKPVDMPCYVETYDDFSMRFASPYLRMTSPLASRLKFSEMTLHKNPVPSKVPGKLTLTWSKRYYDTRMSGATNARTDSVTDYVLDSGMFGVTVIPHVWSEMHDAVKGEGEYLLSRVSEAVQENHAPQQMQRLHDSRDTVQEVTSEMAENKLLVRHHVKFSRDIERGTVLSVQFGVEAVKGFLQPVIKLVNLARDKHVCVEHQRDPVGAFASVATRKAKDAYNNIEEYQNIWKAILEMEAATNAVHSNDSIECSHVSVTLTERNRNFYGTITLKKKFCDERYIRIYRMSEEETHDYMCIRYSQKKSRHAKTFSQNVWLAHATAVDCKLTKREKGKTNAVDIKLTVKCNSMESEPPDELFVDAQCTVEFLQRALPDK